MAPKSVSVHNTAILKQGLRAIEWCGIFSCGEAENSTGGEFLSSSHKVQKGPTVQTNMVAYVVWAIDYKYDVRYDS